MINRTDIAADGGVVVYSPTINSRHETVQGIWRGGPLLTQQDRERVLYAQNSALYRNDLKPDVLASGESGHR